MTDRQLMQQALDALKIAEVDGNCYYAATELLRTRLAQPEQESLLVKRTRELVEWLDACGIEGEPLNNVIALLDAPPAQPAQHGITKGGKA